MFVAVQDPDEKKFNSSLCHTGEELLQIFPRLAKMYKFLAIARKMSFQFLAGSSWQEKS